MPDGVDPKPWHKIHLWQIQVLRDTALIAAFFGLLYFGYLIRMVTVPMLLALLLAYLLEPLVRRITASGRIGRRTTAAGLIIATVVLIVIPVTLGLAYGAAQGFGFLRETAQNSVRVATFVRETPLLPKDDEEVARVITELPESVRQAHDGLSNDSWRRLAVFLARNIDTRSEQARGISTWVQEHSRQILGTTIGSGAEALSRLVRAVTSLGVLAFQGFLTAFFFFFFCTGYNRVLEFLSRFIHRRGKVRTLELISKMDRVVAGFVRGRLTIAAIQGVVFSIGYTLIGVPAGVVLGIGVGILSVIPYLALVGIPVSVLLLWLDPPGGFRSELWWIFGAPVVFYFTFQAIDDYILTPTIQGKNTGLDAPFVLFASMAGGILAGVYGLLLAIPVAACVKIVLTEIIWPRVRAWTEGKADDPLPFGSPPTPRAPGDPPRS